MAALQALVEEGNFSWTAPPKPSEATAASAGKPSEAKAAAVSKPIEATAAVIGNPSAEVKLC